MKNEDSKDVKTLPFFPSVALLFPTPYRVGGKKREGATPRKSRNGNLRENGKHLKFPLARLVALHCCDLQCYRAKVTGIFLPIRACARAELPKNAGIISLNSAPVLQR